MTGRSKLLCALLSGLVLLGTLQGTAAASAPEDASCARYGCVYEHCSSYYSRGGAQSCPLGIAYEPLPDGPGNRRFVYVQWPAGYDPGRRAMWNDVAFCESTLRWDYNGPSGYDGGLQFSPATWRAYGGGEYAPYAWQAWSEQQVAIAERVLRYGHGPHAPQGKGAWPHCGRKLQS